MTGAELPIRRNTLLLAAALAANSGMLQLSAAVASLTLTRVLDVNGLLGLGPAIVLAAGAAIAVPAGRAMDRVGRVPVLAAGFCVGAAGCALAAIGSSTESAPLVLLGLAGVGIVSATGLLARIAAGDMYPPERRARGIAYVLFGAVFGAILGPTVFSPLVSGRDLDGSTLAALWLSGGAFMIVALALVTSVRPDTREIAMRLGRHDATETPSAAPLRELLARPGVVPALVAAQASFAVMVAVMTLTGAIVVDHHHHEAHHVFPIIAAHVVGMYALVIVVGDVIERIGRTISLSGGLLVMAASALALVWIESVAATAIALFALGLGWNVSFVAATAEMADRTQPWERGKLLGLNDLLAGLTGAALALLGGVTLSLAGVAALAIGAAALVAGPALWISLRRPSQPEPAAAPAPQSVAP